MKHKLIFLAILLSIIMAEVFAVRWFRKNNQVHSLTLATGDKNGEYYAFGQALAKVVARHCPQIQLEVLATEGSQANLELLEEKRCNWQSYKVILPLRHPPRQSASYFQKCFT